MATTGTRPRAASPSAGLKSVIHAATGVDANRTVERLGRVAGIFEGRPRALQEVAVLRVHDRRVARAQAEELGIEPRHLLERHAGLHIVRIRDQTLGNTRLAQLVV